MRPIYPNCFIEIDDSQSSDKVIRSLKYSTHCEYFINGFNNVLESIEFPHFHESFKLSNMKDKEETTNFYIDCTNGNFIFNQKQIDKSFVRETICNLERLIERYSHLLKLGISNLNSEEKKKIKGDIVFLIDFEGECKPIAAFLETDKRVFFTSTELQDKLHEFRNEVSINKLKDVIFTIAFHSTKADYNIIPYISKYRPSWDIYRALGINIPLISIQNLFYRKIATYLFIDPSLLHLKNSEIFYKFKPSYFYFDLDETLICRGKPVKEIIEYLFCLKNNKEQLILLTRHIHDIKRTLISIGIDPAIFKEIIKVEKEEKKSLYIKKNINAIFIDNEFPERYDVWRNSNINVLDLDQVDFIRQNPKI